MVQVTQPTQEEQKYVTDGTHVYHYNEYLAELVENGTLKYCDRPLVPPPRKKKTLVPNEPVMEDVQQQLAGGLDEGVGDGQPAPAN